MCIDALVNFVGMRAILLDWKERESLAKKTAVTNGARRLELIYREKVITFCGAG